MGDRADQEDVAPRFEGVLRRREVKSHDPGGSERSIRTGPIGNFLLPTPHPFAGDPRRDQGREEPSYQHSN